MRANRATKGPVDLRYPLGALPDGKTSTARDVISAKMVHGLQVAKSTQVYYLSSVLVVALVRVSCISTAVGIELRQVSESGIQISYDHSTGRAHSMCMYIGKRARLKEGRVTGSYIACTEYKVREALKFEPHLVLQCDDVIDLGPQVVRY